MNAPFAIEKLANAHDRAALFCGVAALDRYLKEQASQDEKRHIATCFVALDAAQAIAGYYTLAAASIPLSDLPKPVAKRLPRYPVVPAARLGRLAVSLAHRGKGLGGALVFDALIRAARSEVAAHAMIVDAKDGAAKAFYQHHGFLPFEHLPLTLFLPLATVRPMIAPK